MTGRSVASWAGLYAAATAATVWLSLGTDRPAVVWFPDGIAFAALWLASGETRYRLAVAFAIIAFTGLLAAYPAPFAALLAGVTILRSVVMVAILPRLLGGKPLLGSWRGVVTLHLVAITSALLFSPLMAAPEWLRGAPAGLGWLAIAGTLAVGTIVVAPVLLIGGLEAPAEPVRRQDWAIAAALLVVVVALFIADPQLLPTHPSKFLAVPPILWAAWRFRARGAALGLVVMGVLVVAMATAGIGHFGDAGPDRVVRMMSAQLFLGTVAITGLGMGAVLEAQRLSLPEGAVEIQPLRRLLDDSAEGIVIRNIEGRLMYLNPAALRLFEAECTEQMVGQHVVDFVATEDRDRLPPFHEALGNGTAGTIEVEMVTLRGRRRRIQLIATPLRNEAGAPFAVLGTVKEISRGRLPRPDVRSEERIRALAGSIELAREAERSRISRELHDELGQALVGLSLDLRWLRNHVTTTPGVQPRIESMEKTLELANQEVRRLTSELRPAMLDDLGLAEAIEWQAAATADRAGLDLVLDLDEVPALDRDRATAVFRIAQEAITNVARHANATRLEVSLRTGAAELTLSVADDGRGFDVERAGRGGFGLLGMRERALTWGGSVSIEARTTGGTNVTLTLPLPRTVES